MTHRLTTNCAKCYCNRTLIVKVIVENVVTCFFGTRCRALESVSIASALSTALIPFTHARSESINADSLNSNFLQLGRRSGGRPQRAVHPHAVPVNTVIRTTLVGLEPATFRSLVRRATSSATETSETVSNAYK